MFVCLPPSFHCFVDILFVALGNQGKNFFIRRIYRRESLARLRRDPLTSDQKAFRSSQEIQDFVEMTPFAARSIDGTVDAIFILPSEFRRSNLTWIQR